MKQLFNQSLSILILFVFFTINALVAQSSGDTVFVKIIAHPSEDSIQIRWAPLDFKMWENGIQNGYKLERREVIMTVDDDGISHIQYGKLELIGQDFKPLPLKEWEELTKDNDFASVAAGAIYGERFRIKDPSNTSAVEIYDANSDAQNRFGFGLYACDQSFETAKAAGLAYVDKNVEKGKRYYYIVSPVHQIPDYVNEPGIIDVIAEKPTNLIAPGKLEGAFSGKAVRLSWDMSLISMGAFTSFEIMRSEDGGRTFLKRNDLPYVYLKAPDSEDTKAYYVDTLEETKKIYQYRIVGKTPFEQKSPPSNIVKGEGLPPVMNTLPFIHNIITFPEGELAIKWRFDASFNDKIDGFDLYRASKVDGHYEKINKKVIGIQTRQYLDEKPMATNYYIVAALDKNGYTVTCVPQLGQLTDAEPPAAPIDLSAKTDTAGRITIQWKQNKEADLLGYRVFYANQKEATYSQLTRTWVEDTFYYHTVNLKRLSEKVYFKIRALDYHENYSPFSEILEVKLPDIVPPIAPVFVKTEARTTGIYLKWRNSSSEDVESYKLHRKRIDAAQWETLVEFSKIAPIYQYFDTTASFKYSYHYKILAIDDDGQMSNSKILTMKPIDTGLRTAITNITSFADREHKRIQLNWHYPTAKNLNEFVIYRAKEEEQMTTYKIMSKEDLLIGAYDRNSSKFSFNDSHISINTAYKYIIMAKFVGGGYSPLSADILVKY